ncbi:MAG: hypothetical protein COA69_05065 [Robiginitomaculum sp.]|nr:MAG: hypothetical protein COA69_05065 [Robiginitomaculum sp.]
MGWNRERAPKLVDDLNILLENLDVEWGFTNQISAADLAANGETIRALDFTKAVLVANGMKPEDKTNWMRQIKRKFVSRYGQSVSTASYGF